MAQNLRELFKNETENHNTKMSQGHETRFLEKLDIALPKEQAPPRFRFLNIAASVIVLLGLGYVALTTIVEPEVINDTDPVVSKIKTMGDISPDLKKVEDYYLASINLELSKVKLTPENKELVDGYIARLKELNDEYDNLTIELNDNGPNDNTLNALIDNLKLRLNLVMRLKEKLQEFNSSDFSESSI